MKHLFTLLLLLFSLFSLLGLVSGRKSSACRVAFEVPHLVLIHHQLLGDAGTRCHQPSIPRETRYPPHWHTLTIPIVAPIDWRPTAAELAAFTFITSLALFTSH